MTLEQAIEVLKALKTHYDIQGPGTEEGTECHLICSSIDTALSALREPALDENGLARCGCWYCEDGAMQVSDSPNKPPVEAKYCGLCGKKLEVTE